MVSGILSLASIPTLRELYAAGTLKAVAEPRFPVNQTLLDRVSMIKADITTVEVDAIVNAANEALLGGGGVDGAIHLAAGEQLLEECKGLGGARTGEAKITKGYLLPSKHVIHTVGPEYSSKDAELCAKQLASCYNNCLKLATANTLQSIAFCSISTSIYGYPIQDAAVIALQEVRKYLDTEEGSKLQRVVFVVFNDIDKDVYERTLPAFFPSA